MEQQSAGEGSKGNRSFHELGTIVHGRLEQQSVGTIFLRSPIREQTGANLLRTTHFIFPQFILKVYFIAN
jgi:hypothetical protein